MARIRTIKPTWWTDEKLALLPRDIRSTFLGLISAMADDEGRSKGDPRLVKAAVWPLDDDLTVDVVAGHLETLAKAGRIVWYQVAGVWYVQIIHFRRHQYIQKPKASELPAPAAQDASATSPVDLLSSPNSGPVHVPDASGLDGMGMEGNGKGSGADARAREADPPAPDPAPPAVADATATPPAPPSPLSDRRVRRFCTVFYGDAEPERKRDITDQLLATLTTGARYRKGEYVRAGSLDRLGAKCWEILNDPPRDKDTAIVVLLKKLADVSRESPTEAAAANASASSADDAAQVAREVAAFKAEHPHDYAAIEARAAEKYPGDDPMRTQIRNAWMLSEIGARRRRRTTQPA